MTRWLFLFLLALATPASAADTLYPQGSRIGLVPPPGLVVSTTFMGFEDRTNNVGMVFAALPAEAYAEIEKSNSAESLKQQGAELESRETLTLPSGNALLLVGRGQTDKTVRMWLLVAAMPGLTAIITTQVPDAAKDAYPDSAIRAALMTLSTRAEVPVAEQLGMLPFKVGELAGFKVGGVLPGRALILTDEGAQADRTLEPHMLVAVVPGAPVEARDRADFAREVFGGIPNLKDVRITSSEPLRIGGQQAHEIMATAKDAGSGTEVKIVQWLRFGGGGYLHLVGLAPSTLWTPAYSRFRSVRDGIEPR